MARNRDRRERSRGSAPDPVRAAAKVRATGTGSQIVAGRQSKPTTVAAAKRHVDSLRVSVERPERVQRAAPASARLNSPTFVGYDATKPRVVAKKGKVALDRIGTHKAVAVGAKRVSRLSLWEKEAPTKKENSARPGKVSGQTNKSGKQTQTNKPEARRSDQRDARPAKKSGSAKLSDPNFKGYDASRGKPGKRDMLHCKERPTDTKPKGGGGGPKKRFIPWC